MCPNQVIQDGANQTVRRVGFWLGIVLFALILSAPTPRSMYNAARHRILQSDTASFIPNIIDHKTESIPADAVNDLAEVDARKMMGAAAVTTLVACWWITVAIPIPVTSLLPLILFPIVGVMSIQEAASPYANSNVFLFMGGFIIALGIERWHVHRRVALHIIRVVGTSPTRIVFGFILASAALSMWISNTATTLMMLPIGLAVIRSMNEFQPESKSTSSNHFAAAVMLGIAYASSIGGMATPIGTPPNISFRGQFARLYPQAPEISFGQWLLMMLPIVVIFLPIVWLVITRMTCPVSRASVPVGSQAIDNELKKMGHMRTPEKRMLSIFLITAMLWITRSIPIAGHNYGWSIWIDHWFMNRIGAIGLFRASSINDTTVALVMACVLFMIPAERKSSGKREYLMDWSTAEKLPWGILLLFGGGFAIAASFVTSGLSYWCGQVFAECGLQDPLTLVAATCFLMTMLTEITSNTATTQVMLPILAKTAHSLSINPLVLMLPATMSASCAFMMPVATPPNAIVFGSGYVTMGRMVRTGIIINLIGVVLITISFYLLIAPILGIEPGLLPEWANTNAN